MTIQLFDAKATASKLTALNNATSPDALQTLFVNVVYQALVKGNANLERMTALRDSKAAPKFKAALTKHMPIKWNGEAKQYQFDKDKAMKLRLELGIKFEHATIEEVASVLPELFAPAVKRETKAFDLAEYLATVAKKLDKEGIANADDIAGLVALLANNADATKAAVQAAYKVSIAADTQPQEVAI